MIKQFKEVVFEQRVFLLLNDATLTKNRYHWWKFFILTNCNGFLMNSWHLIKGLIPIFLPVSNCYNIFLMVIKLMDKLLEDLRCIIWILHHIVIDMYCCLQCWHTSWMLIKFSLIGDKTSYCNVNVHKQQ